MKPRHQEAKKPNKQETMEPRNQEAKKLGNQKTLKFKGFPLPPTYRLPPLHQPPLGGHEEAQGGHEWSLDTKSIRMNPHNVLDDAYTAQALRRTFAL